MSNKSQTQTATSAPWKPAQPALELGLKDASSLYKTGVGSQPYTGSTVVPYAKQTMQGIGQMQQGATAAQPAFQQNFGQVAANASQGGLNALQQGAVNQLKPLSTMNPTEGLGQLNNVQREAYGQFSNLSKAPIAEGLGQLNNMQRASYDQFNTMGKAPVAEGLSQLNDAQRASYDQFNALGKAPVAEGLGQLNDVQKRALDMLNPIAGGQALQQNPYLDEVIRRSSQDISDSVGLSMSGAGRYGSGTHQGVVADSVGDMSSNLRFSDYNNQLGRMDAAIRDVGNMGNQANTQTEADLARRMYGMEGAAGLANQANAQTEADWSRRTFGMQNAAALGNQANAQTDTDWSRRMYGMEGVAGLGGQANNQFETDMGRKLDATGSLFNAGQQQQSNVNANTGALAGAYSGMMNPGQTMMNIGGMYEDLYGRQLNDQLRIFNETQNAPWEQIARLNGIASGAGQLGSSKQTVAQGPNRLGAGIGGAISGFDSTGGNLWGAGLGALAGLL